ncbi:MAG: FAD-dependent oxidoreductase [Promethearchaeota archaeon]
MKIIVIGANAAGLSAASAIRKNHKDWQIDVYDKGQYISYGSCGIPYYVADEVKSLDSLITLTKETMENKRKIPIHLFHEVKSVDFEKREVSITDIQTGDEKKENYDYLVITTGGKSNTTKISSDADLDHPRVFKVHTLGHAKRLKDFLTATKINSAVIIGGGYIGLEMLEAYEAQGVKNLTVIGPRLNFRSESQDFIQKELEKHNVKIILKKRVKTIQAVSDEKLKVILADGEKIETDLVQLSIGVVPATDLFKNTKLEMLNNGAIIIDEFCRTNIENVYSAGDCAAIYHRLLKKNVYSPLAPAANRLGRLAGSHIAGKEVDPFLGVIGTAVFKVYDLYCAQTGIPEQFAKDMGYNVQTSLITINELAHYYPGAKKMSVLLRFDPDSHLLLGAEITAPSSLGAKKIDVFATALSMGMTIDDIQQLDLAYAPPFAPAWDPILVAANVARKKCK